MSRTVTEHTFFRRAIDPVRVESDEERMLKNRTNPDLTLDPQCLCTCNCHYADYCTGCGCNGGGPRRPEENLRENLREELREEIESQLRAQITAEYETKTAPDSE